MKHAMTVHTSIMLLNRFRTSRLCISATAEGTSEIQMQSGYISWLNVKCSVVSSAQ